MLKASFVIEGAEADPVLQNFSPPGWASLFKPEVLTSENSDKTKRVSRERVTNSDNFCFLGKFLVRNILDLIVKFIPENSLYREVRYV